MDFILNYFEWVNFDREPVLRDYALIDAYTRKEGKSLQKNDLWIAASAQSIGARILTTDRDFDFIHGLFVRRELIDLTVPPAGSP